MILVRRGKYKNEIEFDAAYTQRCENFLLRKIWICFATISSISIGASPTFCRRCKKTEHFWPKTARTLESFLQQSKATAARTIQAFDFKQQFAQFFSHLPRSNLLRFSMFKNSAPLLSFILISSRYLNWSRNFLIFIVVNRFVRIKSVF